MLGEMATSTLEVKRSEQEKSGHRRDAAEARLERLARLGDENSDDDEEECVLSTRSAYLVCGRCR